MWELNHKEGWVPKNWCFWTVVLEKTLDSPLICMRSNQSILKEINPEYSLEGLMLKLRLQYFGHLMWRANSLKKTLMLGKIEGRRRRWQRAWWLDGITDSKNMSLNKLQRIETGVLQSMGLQRVIHDWLTEQQFTKNKFITRYVLLSRQLSGEESTRQCRRYRRCAFQSLGLEAPLE